MSPKFITVLGPTACGKTRLSALLADKFNGEIISADSRQVYKYMDIGTGKDLKDYDVGGKLIAYHLVGIIEPSDEYNVYQFQVDFTDAYSRITKADKNVFLTGGTGLYLSSVLQNYKFAKADLSQSHIDSLDDDELKKLLLKLKPNQHNTSDLLNRERLLTAVKIALTNESPRTTNNLNKQQQLVIGIAPPRDLVKNRITNRLKQRLNEGMIDEVQSLINMGITHERLMLFGLEYKFIAMYLKNELSYNDMFQKLNSAIHSFAKRQMTWFRKMEKEGVKINWLSSPDLEKASEIITSFYPE